jgi:hypothetical protein
MERPIPVDIGIGLSPEHHALVRERRPAVAWFEVEAETLLTCGGWLREVESVVRDYPLSVHAAGLSLGSVTRPEAGYLGELRELVTRLQPDFVSDHLSWSAVDGIHLPDLLPLPYTEEALASVVRNVTYVQDILKRQILLENPARSLDLPAAALSEAAFLAEVVLRTGCGVVLDVNNLYLSATCLGTNPHTLLAHFLEALEPQSIAEIHLHGSDSAAWKLFESAIATIGPVPTLLEWDTQPPAFNVLQAEAATARSVLFQNIRPGELYAAAP